MIHSCEGGYINIMVAVAGTIPITQLVRCQHIHDGDDVIAVVIPKEHAPVDIAERIAELLDEHGVCTVPDNAEEVAS